MMNRREGILGLLSSLVTAEVMSGQTITGWKSGPNPISLVIDEKTFDSVELSYKGRKVKVSLDEIMDALTEKKMDSKV